MVAFRNLLISVGLVFAASPRSLSSVLALYKQIDTDLKGWSYSYSKATTAADFGTCQKYNQALEKDIDACTSYLKSQLVLSSTDSKAIIKYVNGNITTDLKAGLDVFIARRAFFSRTGEGNTLTMLRSKFQTLGQALKSVVSKDQQVTAQNTMDAIDKLFVNALGYYRGTVPRTSILPRTVATILGYFSTIDTDVNNFNTAIGKTQTSRDAENAHRVLQNTEKDMDAFITQAGKESVASSSDSRRIVGTFTGTLIPDFKQLVDACVAKRSTLSSVGYKDTFRTDLTDFRKKCADLAAAIKKILSSDQQNAMENAGRQCTNVFSSGIAAFDAA